MQTYLVVGGGGFIGSNLVRALLAQNRQVRVLDNFSTGRRPNLESCGDDLEIIVGDIRDKDTVAEAVRGVSGVFMLAALPSVARSVADPEATTEVNINGLLTVLLAARDAGVERLVFSSSSSVYGDTPELPKHEGMIPNPLSPYALSKLTGEHYCRMFTHLYGLKTWSLRYFNVFGPRQDPESDYAAVIPNFVARLLDDQPPVIHGDGLQTRDFTFVEDVVAANLCCMEAPADSAGGVFNVAWGNRTSVLDLATRIAAILGKDIAPAHTEARPGDVRDSQADSTLARERIGWQPQVTFEDGLQRTVAWMADPANLGQDEPAR